MVKLTKLDSVMYEAQRQGRISFYMPNHGESAAQLGSAHALDSKDLVFGKFNHFDWAKNRVPFLGIWKISY